jgi:hypothetical protein
MYLELSNGTYREVVALAHASGRSAPDFLVDAIEGRLAERKRRINEIVDQVIDERSTLIASLADR